MKTHTPVDMLLENFVAAHCPTQKRRMTGPLIHREPGFLRIGRSPRRLVIAHKDRALFSVRSNGLRAGNWFIYFGQ